MFIQVERSTLKQTAKEMRRVKDNLEHIRDRLQGSMSQLSGDTRYRSEVDSGYRQIHALLQQVETDLKQLRDFTDRKAEAFEEADTNGRPQWKDHLENFGKGIVDGLNFIGTVSFHIGKGILKGAWGAVKGLAELVYHTSPIVIAYKWITDPQGQIDAWKMRLDMIYHWDRTAKLIWEGIKTDFYDKVINGDTASRSEFLGEMIFDVGSMFIGVGAISATAKATSVVNTVTKTAAMAWKAEQKVASAVTKTSRKTGDALSKTSRWTGEASPNANKLVGDGFKQGSKQPVPYSPTPGSMSPANIGKNVTDNFGKVDRNKQTNCLSGDPIHTATGAQVTEQTVLTLHGAAAWPVQLAYNSLGLAPSALSPGWTHNYEWTLHVAEAPAAVELQWHAGRRHRFERGEDEGYRCSDEAVQFDTLLADADGWLLAIRETSMRYRFTADGTLVWIENRLGQRLFAEQEAGRLSRLTDEGTGLALTWHYEDALLKRIDDGTREVLLDYNEQGQLIRYTEPAGHAVEMVYTEDTKDGQVKTCWIGGKLHFDNTFDANGCIIAQENGHGQKYTFHYDTTSRPDCIVTTVIDNSGREELYVYDMQHYRLLERRVESHVYYHYNEAGLLVVEQQEGGEHRAMTYDEAGRLLTVTDGAGHTTTYTYAADPRWVEPLTRTNAQGQTECYSYDESGRFIGVTRADGKQASFVYNAQGQQLSATDFGGATTTYQYTAGRLTATVDAEGRRTAVQYDRAGRICAIEDAAGYVTSYVYDANDNLSSVTDPLGRSWQHQYDALDRLVEVKQPSGAVTGYMYDIHSHPERIIDALGRETKVELDEEGRVRAVIDATGVARRYGYDEAGRLAYTENGFGHRHTFAYDTAGRLIESRDALGQLTEAITYDQAGLPVAVVDGAGATTTYRYNALRQLEQVEDGLGLATTFAYNAVQQLIETKEAGIAVYRQQYTASGALASYTDANGHETRYQYDRSGALVEEKRSDSGISTYTYEARGLLATATSPSGQVTHFTYDAAGQLLKREDAAGTVQLGYDADGRVTSIEENGKRTERVYDAAGQLLQVIDGNGHRIGYAYNAAGRMIEMTYPDGKQVQYCYDAAGRLSEVKDWAGRLTRYRYDANGRLIQTERPNRTVEQRQYDAAGRLTLLRDLRKPGIPLQELRYTYNAIGQIVTEADRQYRYDDLKRLVSRSSPGCTTWYAYDRGGNLTESGEEKETTAHYSYTSDNRLAAWGDYPTEIDLEGNLRYLTDGRDMDAYTYDARNRLIKTRTSEYGYDAENRRIWQRERTKQGWRETHYVWDPSGMQDGLDHLLMELDETGEMTATYIYGHGLIGREDAAGHYQAYHYDLRGSTTLLSDGRGNVTDRYRYGIYGEDEGQEGTSCQPFRYNGQDGVQQDGNGLLYMRARYYHPGLKRFLNRDVVRGGITEGQTFNRYAYVNGDPIRYVDPLGLFKCEGKGTGKVTGSLNGLTDAEKTVVNDLTARGKNVEIIPKDPNSKVKTPDFKVDGVKTELKTLENPNVNTGITRIQKGLKQGAETVIIDARGAGLTADQASQIINRASGTYPNKTIPGKVEIWTSEGTITYP